MGKKAEQVYVVKEIVDRRDEKLPNGKSNTYYKVVWEGYPESQATWELSRKLLRHPELKKDVALFNQKRKNIIKIAKKDSKPNQKKNLSQSFQASMSVSTLKKKDGKEKKNEKQREKETEKPKKTSKKNLLPRQAKQQKLLSQSATAILLEPKIKLHDASFDSRFSEPKQKEKIKNALKKSIQAKQAKKKTAPTPQTPLVENIFPLPKIKLPETLPESRDLDPILEQNKETTQKQPSTAVKPVVSSMDQSLQQKSIEPLLEKSLETNAMVEKIKLELTQELGINELVSSKSKPIDFVAPSEHSEEFNIKGMILCKGEYYYMVEENGKTLILTRPEILNGHPYELIVFYEKRINIKPAEINMMIL